MSIVFCFFGASGVGKSTIQHSLPRISIPFMTNYTTRQLREGEIEGLHVNVLTVEQFLDFKLKGLIYEDTCYAGNFYGTPTSKIEELLLGQPFHATKDIIGIKVLREKLGTDIVKAIYIKPPSIDILEKRMKLRGDSPEKIKERIDHIYATGELNNEKYADHVIVNDDLNDSILQVHRIVISELVNKLKGESR